LSTTAAYATKPAVSSQALSTRRITTLFAPLPLWLLDWQQRARTSRSRLIRAAIGFELVKLASPYATRRRELPAGIAKLNASKIARDTGIRRATVHEQLQSLANAAYTAGVQVSVHTRAELTLWDCTTNKPVENEAVQVSVKSESRIRNKGKSKKQPPPPTPRRGAWEPEKIFEWEQQVNALKAQRQVIITELRQQGLEGLPLTQAMSRDKKYYALTRQITALSEQIEEHTPRPRRKRKHRRAA